MHTGIHVYMYTYLHIYIYTLSHIYIFTSIYTNMYIYTYTYIHICGNQTDPPHWQLTSRIWLTLSSKSMLLCTKSTQYEFMVCLKIPKNQRPHVWHVPRALFHTSLLSVAPWAKGQVVEAISTPLMCNNRMEQQLTCKFTLVFFYIWLLTHVTSNLRLALVLSVKSSS